MADENIVTNIVANADFSNLIADVNKVTASLSKLQQQIIAADAKLANQVASINRSFSENLRRTGQFSTHFVTLSSDAAKFGQNLDSGKLKLKDYFRTFQEHTKTTGGLIRELAKQQVALQNAIVQPLGRNAQGLMQFNVQVPQGLDNVKNKTALARQELQILNKVVQDGGVQLINWGKNTQWAGRQLTVGLTVPLAAFGKAAANAFQQADQELVRLTKVYGGLAQTSAAELGKVRKDVSNTARDIASAYGVSFKDTIALAADIAATGKQGNDLLSSVKETSRLAVLGEVDRQDAMKATLAIQNAFKQNTEQLSESINFLNAVENQTSTTLGDLIEAIPKAGTVVQGMGGSVKDLALYLTAMKEGGVNAAEGANAIKSSLASLINPTKVATQMFQGFGIDLKGIVTKNAGNLTGTILELQKALDTLNPLQKQQALEQLFGKFQFARMNALFANLGRQGSQTLQVMDLMKASSQDLANVASRELSQVTESASGKYRRALEGLKADLAGVGEQFLNINTTLLNVVDGVIKFINKLPTPIKQALGFIGGLTALAGPLIMLTGVLANFFGYIIKGVAHFKALFRGGEGWKLLTPEIVAASKAGSLVEKTFYSDAKAASVLKLALEGLVSEFSILEAKAKSGSISVAPAVSTMAGNLVMGAGARQVDPTSPYLSPKDTRSMSHLIHRNADQPNTLFGVVPGAPLVNQKISNNPQMYMDKDLPNIKGVTSISGVSTGVVAEEAAKWHAMTGALAMQSEAEIKALKKEVAQTGLITHELAGSYQALLPQMTELTQLAASESAAIVAELQAGKLTVDQARAKIIALNAEIETMMGQAATQVATAQGRNINLTQVPLLNQPIVDANGKSNMKELTRPGRTRNLLNKIAGNLGVKTFGAPYSWQTTIPKRLNRGGPVFLSGGDIVPGQGNTDTVPAMLTPGEFVVNKKATAENLDLLQAINGPGSNGPGFSRGSNGAVDGGWDVQTSGLSGADVAKVIPGFQGDPNRIYTLKGTAGLYIGDVTDPDIINEFGTKEQKIAGRISRVSINNRMKTSSVPGKLLAAAIKASGSSNRGSTEQFLNALAKNGIISAAEAETTAKLIYDKYFEVLNRRGTVVNDSNNDYWKLADRRIAQTLSHNSEVGNLWSQFSENIGAHTGDTTLKAGGSGASTSALAQTLVTSDGRKIKVGTLTGKNGALFAHAAHPEPFMSKLGKAGLGVWKFASGLARGRAASGRLAPLARANRGGLIGGMVSPTKHNYGIPSSMGTSFMAGVKNPIGSKMASGQGIMGGGLGSLALGIGGSMIGGNVGMVMQIASFIPLLKQMTTLGGIVSKFSSLAALLPKVSMLLGRLTIPGAIITTAIGLFQVFNHIKKSNEEAAAANAMFYGQTAKTASSLGIKYTDLGKTIDSVKQKIEDQKSAGLATYASITSSGVPGITMSIKQLKELKAEVKKSVPEMVQAFNTIDSSKVNELATSLKAQFIEGGMSVEKATKTIYALIAASNKAAQAVGAIGNEGFKAISDQATASNFMLNNVTKLLDGTRQFDSNAFSTGINSIITGLVSSADAMTKVGADGKASVTQAEALNKQYSEINKTRAKGVKIGAEGLQAITAQVPQLGLILTKNETILGVYAKWRLMLSGIQGDLSKLSSAQAQTLSQFQASLDTASQAYQQNGTFLGPLTTKLGTLKTQADNAAKAAKSGGAVSTEAAKKRIKEIDAEIKRLNDLADAQKKKIQTEQDAANAAIEIQKEQLNYRQAVSRGDMDAAAAAQLRIDQLQKEYQSSKAIAAIDERNKAAVAKQEALKQKQQDIIDNNTVKATASGNTAADLTARAQALQSFITQISKLASDYANVKMQKDAGTLTQAEFKTQADAISGNAAAAILEAKKAGLSSELQGQGFLDSKGNPISVGKLMPKTGLPSPTAFTTMAGQIGSQAVTNWTEVTGGKKLSDLWDVLKQLAGQKVTKSLSLTDKDISSLQLGKSAFKSNGDLTDAARSQIIIQKGLKEDDTFTFNKIKYRVTGSGFLDTGAVRVTPRALGGNITAGQMYLVGENGPEIFNAGISGSIIPNGALGASYSIPQNSYNMPQGAVNSSYNNNTYTINIELNGTNITPDDIMRKFKQELALVNAKEGRQVNLGSMRA